MWLSLQIEEEEQQQQQQEQEQQEQEESKLDCLKNLFWDRLSLVLLDRPIPLFNHHGNKEWTFVSSQNNRRAE